MVDRLNGRIMKMSPTGNARRQNYTFAPTSRMTNTFIAAGNDNEEDILSSTATGLYVAEVSGGSANPVTGEFNFAVSEGYLIKNGRIDRPVRGASLVGRGSEILARIDRVGGETKMGQCICSSKSGSIPVGLGQPTIRVSEMTVGGRRSENDIAGIL